MINILEVDTNVYYSSIPREEEGMGVCAGAYLGNKLPCIMMQNTGIGNSVNSIVSLLQLYQMPVIFLISYRGTPGELVSAQGAMAVLTEEILDTLRIPVLNCTVVKDLDKISTFTNHAKVIEGPVAILCNFNLMNEDK
jgi:sulfopyruvate decarboxylase subunit alpha